MVLRTSSPIKVLGSLAVLYVNLQESSRHGASSWPCSSAAYSGGCSASLRRPLACITVPSR
eukprot:8982151-Lingulodinium_polyedra.AAC.1